MEGHAGALSVGSASVVAGAMATLIALPGQGEGLRHHRAADVS
jgi:hypothetical protein